MKVGICFIGLERTIDKTYQNILSNVLEKDHSFLFLFITWQNESTEKFQKLFPFAFIHRVKEITIDGPEFQEWNKGIQMHISWRRTYEPLYALFRYFQQIYLWKQAALFLEKFKSDFDILMRIRTDIEFVGSPIFQCYSSIENTKLYFPSEPKNSIFSNEIGCPDHFFIGKADTVIKGLSIVDYTHRYKINYVEKSPKWFGSLKQEENIVQPETSLYLFLQGEGITPCFLPTNIQVIR